MEINFSALSDADLDALEANDFSKISDAGLSILENASASSVVDLSIPTPMSDNIVSDTPPVERDLSLRQKGVNLASQYMKQDPVGDLFNNIFSGKEFPDYGERDGRSAPYPKITPSKEKLAQESKLKVAQGIAEVPLQLGSDLGSLAYAGLGTAYDFLDPTSLGVDTPFSQRVGEAQNRFPFNYDASEKGEGYYKKLMDNMAALPGTSQFSNVSRMSGIQKTIKADKSTRPITMTDKVNKEIQLFVNKTSPEQLKEFTLNAKKNKVMKESSDAGYVFIPSNINNSRMIDRLKEGSIGTGKVSERAREVNQKVTNNLTRKYLGVSDDTPLDLDLTEKIRKANGKIYAEIDDLPARPPLTKPNTPTRDTGLKYSNGDPIIVTGKTENVIIKEYRNGNEILTDLKSTRKRTTDYWNEFRRQGTVESRDKAVLLEKLSEKLENELIDVAKYNQREDLIPKLKEARTQIAKSHLVQKALNDVTGDVDAKIISKLAYEKRLLDPNIKKVAKMYKGFPQITKIPALNDALPFSVLDTGLSVYGFASGQPILALPTFLKYVSGRSIQKPAVQRNMLNRQLTKPTPSKLKSLLQIPNVRLPRPSEGTFNTLGLASLLDPYINKENQ